MKIDPKNIRARLLRVKTTDAENKLWQALRSRQLSGYKFRRQHPIERFIADFACVEHHVIVEADGGQHNESRRDERRTKILNKKGWRVLRFWNDEILTNIDGVVESIKTSLLEDPPHPHHD
ncbi:MAG: endonuclease domain-containing protein [Bdellovibrionales bacterium]